ncbi:hypothetical protein Y1Q_0014680 [Alligator mississippiensis]|uniref:Uncharacterized protein n=1 Tax=Alligator mississippiensis TaxID=8496 RepID=A0A151P8C5_ALLMI|nr:hypothetical protein Y1Q_0014680 [Alligator mississippiensis]
MKLSLLHLRSRKFGFRGCAPRSCARQQPMPLFSERTSNFCLNPATLAASTTSGGNKLHPLVTKDLLAFVLNFPPARFLL